MSREIKILSLCFFVIFLAYNGVQQFLTAYFSDLGMVKTGFWSLILIYSSLLVANFFSGFIVAKFGVKKCLVVGSLLYPLFIFVLIFKIVPLIYLASVLLGFGASILWTAQATALIRLSNPHDYGKNSGFFSVVLQLGSALGIIIFSFFVVKLSFSFSFAIFGVCALIGTVILLILKKTESKTVGLGDSLRSFKKIFKSPTALKFFGVWFSFSLVIALTTGQFPMEAEKYFGLGSIGLLTPVFYFLPVVFSYFVGKKSDERGRKIFLTASYVFALMGLSLFAVQIYFNLDKLFFVLSFFLISLGFATYAPLRYALIGDISRGDNLEHLAAFSSLASNLGYVVVFLMNLYLPAILSYSIPFLIALASLIIIRPMLKLTYER